jgi:hypothetical protein
MPVVFTSAEMLVRRQAVEGSARSEEIPPTRLVDNIYIDFNSW